MASFSMKLRYKTFSSHLQSSSMVSAEFLSSRFELFLQVAAAFVCEDSYSREALQFFQHYQRLGNFCLCEYFCLCEFVCACVCLCVFAHLPTILSHMQVYSVRWAQNHRSEEKLFLLLWFLGPRVFQLFSSKASFQQLLPSSVK